MNLFGLRRLTKRLASLGMVTLMALTTGVTLASANGPGLSLAPNGIRQTDQSDIALVAKWSRAQAANDYGGVWFGTNGTVYVGFARNIGGYGRALSAIVRQPNNLRVVQVARSWNTLVQTQARIDREVGALRSLGIYITATGIIPDQNKVSVSVRTLNSEGLQILAKRYGGGGLLVDQHDYFRFEDRNTVTPPWVGGMTLTGVCQSSDCTLANCTANFTVYDFINGVPFYYLATAGHCFGYLTHVANGVGVPVGTVLQQFWASGVTADVEVIQENPATHSPNIITHDPTRKGVVGSEATQNQNESVCKSGITTNETCNWTISAVHQTVMICINPPTCDQFVTTYDQVKATNTSPNSILAGDSGGPVYHFDGSGNLWATGIVSAGDSTGTTMIYSFFADALNEVQSYLCTTGAC